MKRLSLSSLCAALAILAVTGCNGSGKTDVGFQAREMGRSDAAWPEEVRARKVQPPEWPEKKVEAAEKSTKAAAKASTQNPMDLCFQDKPALEVINLMRSRFDCEVSLSPAAAEYIRSRDLRISSGAAKVPANLAFETLRGLLEAKGLTVTEARNASTFGRPHFLVDRSAVVEASVLAR